MFLGREVINRYADFLKTNLEILWPMRLCMLAAVVFHVYIAIKLTLENRSKREIGYEVKELVGASLASRTMFISGMVIFCFLVYHLLHFTMGVTNPDFLDVPGRARLARRSSDAGYGHVSCLGRRSVCGGSRGAGLPSQPRFAGHVPVARMAV